MTGRVSPLTLGRVVVAAAALLTAAAPAPGTAEPARPARPPNIIILLADDWGFSDVGAFGGEMATPHLDALAANGLRFSNFHVAGSCSPTRAMLQTGVSSHRAGLGNMPETIPPEHAGRPGYDAVLNRRVVTIADLLRAAGYRTYFTGKWHLGHGPDNLPNSRGYDRSFALTQSGADNFEDKPNLLLYDDADWNEDGRPASLPANFYSSTFIVDRMIDYIDAGRAEGRPFLASVNFLANHIPVQARDADIAAYRGRYNAGWDALRSARRDGAVRTGVLPAGVGMARMAHIPTWNSLSADERAQRAGAMEAYGGMATAMDREIGRLVDHLKRIGEYDNSIFVFLSDNGPEPLDPMAGGVPRLSTRLYYDQSVGQQGRPGSLTAIGPGWASAAAAPLSGSKFSASEGGLRVPMIISWPGNPAMRRGAVVGAFTHVTDIAPTLLSLAGVERPNGRFDGRMIEPLRGFALDGLLTGTAERARPADRPLGYELSGNAALFLDRWKLVRNLPPYGDGRWHLYDIVADPGETVDRAGSEPDRLRQMMADYAAYARADHVLDMPPGYNSVEQIQRNALRNLLLPRLLALWPAALGLLASIAGLIWWRRRRRRRAA